MAKEKIANSTIAIAVATHKPYAMPQSECYLPLHVGAELHPDVCRDMQQDNVGENISAKNAFYSELTGLYWMWKNCDAEFKGLVHYRRHFKGSQATEGPLGKVATTADFLNAFANEKVDAILPVKRNYFIETIEQHYVHTMPEEQLHAAKVIIKKLKAEYMPALEEVLHGKKAHMFNMFVMERTCFDAYCEWLFSLLFELEKELDPAQYDAFHGRYLGRISERLLDPWLKVNNITFTEFPTTSPERVNWVKKGSAFLAGKFLGKKYRKSF